MKPLKKASKKLDNVHARIRALSRRLERLSAERGKGTAWQESETIHDLEKQIEKAMEEAESAEDKAAWEEILKVNVELAAIKKELGEASGSIKKFARSKGFEIGTAGEILKGGLAQDRLSRGNETNWDFSQRQRLHKFLEGIKPGQNVGGLDADSTEQVRNAFGLVKAKVPRVWPKNIPYPILWKQCGGADLFGHKDKDIEDVYEAVKGTFEIVGMKPTHGDLVEMMIDNLLVNEDCRTFCFSKPLLDALRETPLDAVPTELIKLPVPATYFDFSELGITYGLHDHKYEWRGCFLAIAETTLMVMTVSCLVGDFPEGHTPFSFTANPYELPEDGLFVVPVARPLGMGPTETHEFSGFMEETKDFLKLALSALLYVNSINADLREEWLAKETVKKMKKAKGKRKRDMKRHVESMGRVTRAGYHLHIPAMPPETEGESKDKRKIKVRFLCRGFWRKYWVGPNRKKSEIKWIAPHWKGPETADKIHDKMYVVDKPKK